MRFESSDEAVAEEILMSKYKSARVLGYTVHAVRRYTVEKSISAEIYMYFAY